MSNKSKAAIVGTLAISVAVSFIPPYEGRNLVAYLDPVGIPTICEGYTKGVKLGDIATEEECDAKTLEAVKEADRVFKKNVPERVREDMSPNSYASFLSFIYNVGPGKKGVKDGFVQLKNGNMSSILRALKRGDVRAACMQFKYWVSAKGRKLKGLVIRRDAEEKLCLSGIN